MKFARCLSQSLIVATITLAASAQANICYVVYDRNDQVVYRDIRSPIDLSQQIGPQVNAKWRGGALVIVGEALKCIPLEGVDSVANAASATAATTEAGATSSSGDASKAPAKGKRGGKKAAATGA